MDVLEAIRTRTSVPPMKMGLPVPSSNDLTEILEAGAAAPDHGRLMPFRFLVVEGEARKDLGELFVRAMLKADPAARPADLDKQRANPQRAAVVIAVITRAIPEHKIPVVEQLSAGAAAMQNMLLAVHAKGFGGKWVTGKNAYDPMVREGIGCQHDEVVTGFLYLGGLQEPYPISVKKTVGNITSHWPGKTF